MKDTAALECTQRCLGARHQPSGCTSSKELDVSDVHSGHVSRSTGRRLSRLRGNLYKITMALLYCELASANSHYKRHERYPAD
jgi:hypothetical protein